MIIYNKRIDHSDIMAYNLAHVTYIHLEIIIFIVHDGVRVRRNSGLCYLNNDVNHQGGRLH